MLFFTSGALLSGLACFLYHKLKTGSYEQLALRIVTAAEQEAKHQKELAKIEIHHQQLEIKREAEKEHANIDAFQEKLQQSEKQLEKKISEIEKKELQLLKQAKALEKKASEIDALMHELSHAASLSPEEAKELLLEKVEQEIEAELKEAQNKKRKELDENCENEGKRIITTAINRLAASVVSEHTINTVSIPSDTIKARIIGREGRNIRCLERETGVNFLVDDTPGAIVLSCFDPVRLHVAKIALQDLILDGRIHPSRIEEAVEKAKKKSEKESLAKAEEAAIQAGIFNLHPELLALLGKLSYRYSLGQNVLSHSVEVSQLMGMMAAELKLDVALAKRIGLLHDIGKAAHEEIKGSHATIGYQLTQKYGETIQVSNGIGCHHYEMEPITFEGSLCSAADTLSASRPGARIESAENYLKRVQNLERIASDYPGVERVYALQAGREVRVSILPDRLDDQATKTLAKEITKRIENELSYHGKIKITLVRETRVTEYAI